MNQDGYSLWFDIENAVINLNLSTEAHRKGGELQEKMTVPVVLEDKHLILKRR